LRRAAARRISRSAASGSRSPRQRTGPGWRNQVGGAFERLDILVNNAGMMDSRSFFDTELEDFRKTMRVNMEGMFIAPRRCCHCCAGAVRPTRPARR